MKLNVFKCSALGLLTAGCTLQVPMQQPVEQAPESVKVNSSDRDQQLKAIADMQERGIITDTQAQAMIYEIVTGKSNKKQVADVVATPVNTAESVKVVEMKQSAVKKGGIMLDKNLQKYRPGAVIRQSVSSVGSDTMDRLMVEWFEKMKDYHPNMRTQHTGKGSSTAIPALIEEQALVGPMSRGAKPAELMKFKAKYGQEPVALRTAIDALAVFIHPENPLVKSGVSMKQLDAIFSESCKRGGATVKTWGDLGLTGEWADQPIKVYIRNKASGTYDFFRKQVLLKGEFKKDAHAMVGSAEIVQEIANNKFAIGFSGLGYKNDLVETLPLGQEGQKNYAPTYENVEKEVYPLARFLYLVMNPAVDPERKQANEEIARFIFSQQGQEIVVKDGFFPMSSKSAEAELKKLQL